MTEEMQKLNIQQEKHNLIEKLKSFVFLLENKDGHGWNDSDILAYKTAINNSIDTIREFIYVNGEELGEEKE